MAVEIVFETHSTRLDNEHGIGTGWLDSKLFGTDRQHRHASWASALEELACAPFAWQPG